MKSFRKNLSLKEERRGTDKRRLRALIGPLGFRTLNKKSVCKEEKKFRVLHIFVARETVKEEKTTFCCAALTLSGCCAGSRSLSLSLSLSLEAYVVAGVTTTSEYDDDDCSS